MNKTDKMLKEVIKNNILNSFEVIEDQRILLERQRFINKESDLFQKGLSEYDEDQISLFQEQLDNFKQVFIEDSQKYIFIKAKDIHKLQRKITIDKNGHKKTVYVSINKLTGEEKHFAVGDKVSYTRQGEKRTGTIEHLTHEEMARRKGGAVKIKGDNETVIQSLHSINHIEGKGEHHIKDSNIEELHEFDGDKMNKVEEKKSSKSVEEKNITQKESEIDYSEDIKLSILDKEKTHATAIDKNYIKQLLQLGESEGHTALKKYRITKKDNNVISVEIKSKYTSTIGDVPKWHLNKVDFKVSNVKSKENIEEEKPTILTPDQEQEELKKEGSAFKLQSGDKIYVEYKGKEQLLSIKKIDKKFVRFKGINHDESTYYVIPPIKNYNGEGMAYKGSEIKVQMEDKLALSDDLFDKVVKKYYPEFSNFETFYDVVPGRGRKIRVENDLLSVNKEFSTEGEASDWIKGEGKIKFQNSLNALRRSMNSPKRLPMIIAEFGNVDQLNKKQLEKFSENIKDKRDKEVNPVKIGEVEVTKKEKNSPSGLFSPKQKVSEITKISPSEEIKHIDFEDKPEKKYVKMKSIEFSELDEGGNSIKIKILANNPKRGMFRMEKVTISDGKQKIKIKDFDASSYNRVIKKLRETTSEENIIKSENDDFEI